MAQWNGCLVGCGYFAQFQMEAWKRLSPLAEINAVCDLDETRAYQFAAKYGVAGVYTDLAAMLDAERPAFLDIVTRPEQHLAMARAAAERGIHVLCQKPFAPTIAEAEEIVGLFERAGVRVMANENFRWQGWYREIKRIMDSGAIGRPFSFRWEHRMDDGLLEAPYPNQPYFVKYPRFLIYETLVHYLDCARFLFGDPDRVSCVTARVNPKIAGEDLALITLQYANGLAGVIDGNRCSPPDPDGPAMGGLRIDGLNGSLWMEANGRIWIAPRGSAKREHRWEIPDLGYRGGSCYNTQRHFVECLESGAPFETSGRDYLKTMRLVDACYESSENKFSVTLREQY